MASTEPKFDAPPPATLSRRALSEISQITQDVRLTLKRLEQPDCSPLAVVDGDAVDAIKDLYYVVNREDPNNVMPARKLLCEQKIVSGCLLPLLASINSDPTVQENQKRWSVSLYHTFRVLSSLTVPVLPTNELLKPGCVMDSLLMDIRVQLVREPRALEAIVALLQYYIERKAEKQARFAPAEESKIEDARIENILGFFRNILMPPRIDQRNELKSRDLGVHLALVGYLFEADMYSTLAILFSSKDEARGQLTDLVYTVADIYRFTYRLSSPNEIAAFAGKRAKTELVATEVVAAVVAEKPDPQPESVFNLSSEPGVEDPPAETPRAKKPLPSRQHVADSRNRRGASLRDAMTRERSLLGGARAVTTSSRWSNRHSGGFTAVASKPANSQNAQANGSSTDPSGNLLVKRIVAARGAIDAKKDAGPDAVIRNGIKLNSELLCAVSSVGASKKMVVTKKNSMGHQVRTDLQEKGRKSLSAITIELIEVSFQFLIRELRDRIEEARGRPGANENEDLAHGRRSFLALIATVVGFQRDFASIDAKHSSRALRRGLQMHKGDMESYIASEVCAVGNKWLDVEAGIEHASFKVAFDVLIQFSSTGKQGAEDVELATFAIRQMMKLLQSMTLHPEKEEDIIAEMGLVAENAARKKIRLTGREMALNTLEDLFSREDYLNAPCSLAKDYDARFHSFNHLANIVEVAHAFTSTLLDEKELGQIQVQRKKRKIKKKKTKKEESKDNYLKSDENDGNVPAEEGEANSDRAQGNSEITGQCNGPVACPRDHLAGNMADKNDESTEANNGPLADTRDQSSSGAKETCDEETGGHTNEQANGEKPTGDVSNAAAALQGENSELPLIDEEEIDGNNAASESEDEMITREVESSGVVRRFAHSRALQVLSLPIRASLCRASTISGALYPVPDGARSILSCSLAAKSLAVLTSIWSTSGRRDKGALRGHFFSFSLLQLMSVGMNASSHKNVSSDSIISRLAEFGVQVTRGFHDWLTVNPGLALDCFLSMDKTTCNSYAHSLHLKTNFMNGGSNANESDDDDGSGEEAVLNQIDEQRARLEAEEADLNNDSDIIEDDIIPRESRKKPRKKKSKKTTPRERRPRPKGATHEEDTDVDDLDALKIGPANSENEANDGPTAMETLDALEKSLTPRNIRRQKRKSTFTDDADLDSSDSDDSSIKPKGSGRKQVRKKRKGTSKSTGRRRGSSGAANEAPVKSDKFYAESSDDLNDEDMKLFNYAPDGEVGNESEAPRNKNSPVNAPEEPPAENEGAPTEETSFRVEKPADLPAEKLQLEGTTGARKRIVLSSDDDE